MASRRVAWAVFAAVGAALGAVAFWWGAHLFGVEWGLIYVAVVLAVLRLFALALMRAGGPSPLGVAGIAVLAAALGFVMASPASINPDVRHFIDKQAVDRAARAELALVFASDPAYRDLSVSTVHRKVVNVTIRGSLGTRADLNRLRDRVAAECPAAWGGGAVLVWDVTLRDPAERISGSDRDLFGPRE